MRPEDMASMKSADAKDMTGSDGTSMKPADTKDMAGSDGTNMKSADAKDMTGSDGTSMKPADTTVMAYIGDAVYETYVRCYVLSQHQTLRAGALHKISVRYVKSDAQALIIRELETFLTAEEKEVVRRARNRKSISRPKNASPIDYKLSTGFEALIGYLYIKGNKARCDEVMRKAVEIMDREKGTSGTAGKS